MQNTRLRRTAAVVVAVVFGMIVTGCAGEAGLGGPRLGGTPAATVGDVAVTSSDLETDVEAWASSPESLAVWPGITQLGEKGRRSSELVTFVLTLRIQREQAEQLLVAYGREVTTAGVEAVERELRASFLDPATGRFIFDGYDPEFRRYILESFAIVDALSQVEFDLDGQPLVSPPAATVNPRYGQAVDAGGGWASVVPPSGPQPEPFTFG